MENFISGLANIYNFSVKDQLITWKSYNIPAHNITLVSVGVSSTYSKAPQGSITRALIGAISAIYVIDQIENEDDKNLMDMLSGFYNLCIEKEKLPCLNLLLNNGVMLEITFIDILSFWNGVKNVKAACSYYAGINNMVVEGNNIHFGQLTTNGRTQFFEQNSYKITSGEEEQ